MTWRGHACVQGEAQSMGSKRILMPKSGKAAGRPFLVDDNKPGLRSWQREMKSAMCDTAPPDGPLDCAVGVRLLIYVARPLSQFRVLKAGTFLKDDAPTLPPTGRDVDKVLRAVLDCGTGIWWRDDKRVADVTICRLYSDHGARTEIEAWAAEAPRPEPPGQGVLGEFREARRAGDNEGQRIAARRLREMGGG